MKTVGLFCFWPGLAKRCVWAFLLIGLFPATVAARNDAVLSVGVFPYLSTHVLLTTYEPLRTYLQRSIGQPVNIYTARNYSEYYFRAIKGDYDVAIFPPHLALLAQREGGQMAIARFSRIMHGVFVTTTESPITTLEDLRGVQLATPDSASLVAILGVEQLQSLGLLPSRDYSWRPNVSHNSALLNLQRGSAQVALVANSALDQIPPEQRANIRVLAKTDSFPALVIMTRRNLPIKTRMAVQAALLKWHDRPDGRRAVGALKFAEIVSIEANELEPFNVYLQATRNALRKPIDETQRR